MSIINLPQWETITREERFFTCILFYDIRQNSELFLDTLRSSLGCGNDVTVVDSGYEVCFFRDAARENLNLIERHPELEKQTFDLVLWLSNQALVIIEAKAQQGFTTKQMDNLQKARKIMQSSAIWPIKQIYLVGLYSDDYKPRPTTRANFDALLQWNEIADIYPMNEDIYHRATKIYQD